MNDLVGPLGFVPQSTYNTTRTSRSYPYPESQWRLLGDPLGRCRPFRRQM